MSVLRRSNVGVVHEVQQRGFSFFFLLFASLELVVTWRESCCFDKINLINNALSVKTKEWIMYLYNIIMLYGINIESLGFY